MPTSAPTQSPKTPQPATTALKQLPFAFPFLRKAQGKAGASAPFTDEHDIYRLLAEREKGGEYLVSRQGVWHGGIHVTESGAGQALDLDAGVRCIADGVLIAFRANRTYPVSEMPASKGGTSAHVPYSTSFALIRHEMEFPRGSKLTFYSLYMHLMANEDYDRDFPKRQKPSYWPRQWTVTGCAKDRPSMRAGQAADSSQVGLRVRQTPNGHIVGIVPQGASVSIGKTKTVHGATWGQLTDLHGAALHPPEARGYVAPRDAVNGWINLGQRNGGPVVNESIPDSVFDRVIVTTDQRCTKADSQGAGGGIPVKAGDAIGHLGRFDALNGNTTGDRRVHVEVFCDDSIVPLLSQGRHWIAENGAYKEKWKELGLPFEPTILRIEPGTVLYQRTADNRFIPGSDPQPNKTAVVQVYLLAELARGKDNQFTEKDVDAISKRKLNWYQVESANALGHAIKGWVRESNHPGGGRVTREFAQKWIDFNALPADAHDPAHTIFATVQDWLDYMTKASVPEPASRAKLSPLMQRVYDAVFTTGDGKQAAEELGAMSTTARDQYPWLMQSASRLIVKHESEWSNPSKWQQLYAALGKQLGPEARLQHDAEQARIEKLVWWDAVQAGVQGFPGPNVFHINPVGLATNFQSGNLLITLAMLKAVEPSNSDAYYESLLLFVNKFALTYQVNNPNRIAHFLSQVAHESKLRSSEEGLNYSSKGMRKIFGCKGGPKKYDSSCDDCASGRLRGKLWGEEEFYAHNPEHLANYVYANRMGNGNEDSGDGYRYRGRGFIQITGKDGYQSFQDEHNRRSPENQQNFIKNPDLLSTQTEYAIESAFVFWSRVNLNSLAETGTVADVTQIVNGGQTGYGDRLARYNAIAPLLGLRLE